MHCTLGENSDFASNIHSEVAVEPVTANARNRQGQQGAEDKSMGHKDVYREGKDGWPGVSDRSDSLTEILKRGELRHSRLLKMAGSGYTVEETRRGSREASEQYLRQSIQLKAEQRESKARMGWGRNISGAMPEMPQSMHSALNILGYTSFRAGKAYSAKPGWCPQSR